LCTSERKFRAFLRLRGFYSYGDDVEPPAIEVQIIAALQGNAHMPCVTEPKRAGKARPATTDSIKQLQTEPVAHRLAVACSRISGKPPGQTVMRTTHFYRTEMMLA